MGNRVHGMCAHWPTILDSCLLFHELVLLVRIVSFCIVLIRHDILLDLACVLKPASRRFGVDVCVNDMHNAPVQQGQLQHMTQVLLRISCHVQ